MSAAPPQSMGHPTGYGWTNAEMFMVWLKHSRTQQNIHGLQVRILDHHHSHKTQEAIKGAHAHGITLITFPPPISHKMWPLNRTSFKAPLP